MKKIFAIILTAAVALALAACGGSGGNTGGNTKPKTIAEDTNLFGMSFVPPEGYETVERFIDRTEDGTISEKDISFYFADGTTLGFAYATGLGITEADLSSYETKTVADKTFYLIESGSTLNALALAGGDVLYGISFDSEDEGQKELFEKALEGLSFTDSKEAAVDDEDLFGIRYSLEGLGKVASSYISAEETPTGELKEKTIMWRFGTDADNIDYRFYICVYKNTTMEEKRSESKTYEEQEINGITYTVAIPDDEEPYEYYVQHGEDLYQIRNAGTSSGWWTSRSDASVVAFQIFLKSISFE